MDTAAADARRVSDWCNAVPWRPGSLVFVMAKRLAMHVIAAAEKFRLDQDRIFIVGEVGGIAIGALFQHDRGKACGRQLFGENPAGRAGPDDNEVDFLASIERLTRHRWCPRAPRHRNSRTGRSRARDCRRNRGDPIRPCPCCRRIFPWRRSRKSSSSGPC